MTNQRLLGALIIIFIIGAAGYFTFTKFKQEVSTAVASPSPSPANLEFIFTKQDLANATSAPAPQTATQKGETQPNQAQPGANILPYLHNKYVGHFQGILRAEVLLNKKAVIETGKGKFELEIYPEASKAASNFLLLSVNGFYDGLTFHRVEPGFVVQGGDPLGNGTGGPGYTFEDEVIIREYIKGIVAYANAGPNTNGSQFFILLSDHPELPKKYTIFGQVTSGMDVVEKLTPGDVMQKVTIQPLH